MDTDSFINSMSRSITRRGTPELMRSGNGTSFVGGNKELRFTISQWNVQQIHGFFLQRHIKWIFNPPLGSHHGVVWERRLRTVRKVPNAVQKEHALDDEGLSTLISELKHLLSDWEHNSLISFCCFNPLSKCFAFRGRNVGLKYCSRSAKNCGTCQTTRIELSKVFRIL